LASGIKIPYDNLGDNGISQNILVPMSWDYIFFLAKSIFGTWSSFAFFDEIFQQEIMLQQTINKAINRKLHEEIKLIINDSTDTTNVNFSNFVKDSAEQSCIQCVKNNFTNDMMSTIFNTLLEYRPERFINNYLENTKYDYPFVPGDTIGFTVTINPSSSQQYIGKSNSFAYQAGNDNESVTNQQGSTKNSGTRIYYITIVINSNEGNSTALILEEYINRCNQQAIFANNTASTLYSITNSFTQIIYQLNSAMQAYYDYLYKTSGIDFSMNEMLRQNIDGLFTLYGKDKKENSKITGEINSLNINVKTLYSQYSIISNTITADLTQANTLFTECGAYIEKLQNTLNGTGTPTLLSTTSPIVTHSNITTSLRNSASLAISGLTAGKTNLNAAIGLTNSVFGKGNAVLVFPENSTWDYDKLSNKSYK
jgi:hypothetical protein